MALMGVLQIVSLDTLGISLPVRLAVYPWIATVIQG